MNLAEYIGLNNPEGANRVLRANGYVPCEYLEDCPDQIMQLMDVEGPAVTEQLLMEHPDFDIISELALDNNKQNTNTKSAAGEQPPVIVETITPRVNSEIPKSMINDSLKEILIIIMSFWLVNKIISS